MSGLMSMSQSELNSLMKNAFAGSKGGVMEGCLSGRGLLDLGLPVERIHELDVVCDNGNLELNFYSVSNNKEVDCEVG